MKKKITSLLDKPKQVTIISLAIALFVGVFGYISINKKSTSQSIPTATTTDSNNSQTKNISLGFLSGGRINSVKIKSGDMVTKGQELASLDSGNTLGALTQAKASYDQAKANYEKLIHGATGPAIDVAKAAVNTAQINLTEARKQQDILVGNAKRNLLNSTFIAKPKTEISQVAPTISGTYTKDVEGVINLETYGTGDGAYFNFSGIATGTGKVSSIKSTAIGDTGLSIIFSENAYYGSWTINIPNTEAANYLVNYNAYNSALQTRTQTIAQLQAVLDQANASLEALVTTARPEDVAVSQAQVDTAFGAIQIAQAAYNNTIIKAPYDGIVRSVSIAVGQIATANIPAIELEVNTTNIK